MTPTEYFTRCAEDCFNESAEQLIDSRRRDKNTAEHLKQVLLTYKKKFPLPYIDYATHYTPSQEGLHRMMVAGDLFGWDKEFPVQIIRWVDEERAKQEKEWKHKREIERYLERAINKALRYKYYNIEELKDQLYSEFESEVRYVDEFEDRVFKFELVDSGDKEDPGFLAIIDNKYEGFIPQDKIQWMPKKDDTDSDDLEDINYDDLSDWMKELLGIKESLSEHYAIPREYLVSKQLDNELKAEFGDNYSEQPICKSVCEYIKSKCPKCEVLAFAVGVWKQIGNEFECISNKGHCVIKLDDTIYDYTSNQYVNYGIDYSEGVRILEQDYDLTKALGADIYRNNNYIIAV